MLGSYLVSGLVLNAEKAYYRGQRFLSSWHSQSSEGDRDRQAALISVVSTGVGKVQQGDPALPVCVMRERGWVSFKARPLHVSLKEDWVI